MTKPSSFLRKYGVTHTQVILDNGIHLQHFERPNSPISVRAAFRSGAAYDTTGKDGLAHFAEHMLVAGTASYPSKDKLTEHIENIGGILGATTGSEFLSLNMTVAETQDFAVVGHLLDEMLNKSLLTSEAFKSEKGSVIRELGAKLSSPPQSLAYYFTTLLYGAPANRTVLGDASTIEAIALEDIRRFFDEKLILDRMTLVTAGGITAEQIAAHLTPYAFRVIPDVRQEYIVHTAPPTGSRVHIAPFTANDQIDFLVGFRTCGLASVDQYALRIIQTVLGGGRAASLMRRLRYEKGYIYSGRAAYFARSEADGVWVFLSACAKKDLQATLDIIASEFKRAYEGKLTSQEITFAKNKILKSLAMQMETSEEWVDFHAQMMPLSPDKTIDDYIKGITECSAQDIAAVGHKYFVPGQWQLVLAGNITPEEVSMPF